MKEPRVKGVIKSYEDGNIVKVYEYLTQADMIVDPSTWSGKIKKMIEDKVPQEIAKENAQLEQEREAFKKKHAEELKRLGKLREEHSKPQMWVDITTGEKHLANY